MVLQLGLQRRPPRITGAATLALTWAGNRRLWGDRTIRRLLLAQWLPNGLIVGAEAMYVPYLGRGAGAMYAGAAIGMLAGDIVIGRWASTTSRAALSLPLYALLAVPYLFFVLHPAPAVATILVVVASFGYAGTLGVQEQFVTAVPEEILGQGMGLASSGMLTAQAVCAVAVGGVAQLSNPAGAIAVAAVASLAASVVLLWPSRSALGTRSRPPGDTASMPHVAEPEQDVSKS
jgi:hypothetical protein